jgi:undecaprenyl-phosphate 4-deoxy-4-formamido-L-arabinose transferase
MDRNHRPDVSIVIPVYGSAAILPELTRRLEVALKGAFGVDKFEVVMVEDCGPDRAWQVIGELAAARPWLRGIQLRKNAGQHNAIMAGLRQTSGRFVVTMDDDLQHDPDDVPRLVATLEAGHDLCYAQFNGRQHALWKRLGSRFNDVVASRLLKKPRGLYLSPFRAMRSAIRDEVLRYEGPFVYVDGLLLQSTNNIATIQAQHHARSDGKSGYSVRKSISLWLQMATSFSVTPLRFVSIAGIAASCIGFLLAVVVFISKLMSPGLPVGWASLIIAVLLMGGLQLLALGAIGEYVGRVLLSLNRRPQYVIRRRLNLRRDDGLPDNAD